LILAFGFLATKYPSLQKFFFGRPRNAVAEEDYSINDGMEKSRQAWKPWGDAPLYRNQNGGTNNIGLGVLTKVNFKTAKRAVELLSPTPFRYNVWYAYIRWAIGTNGSFNGALVDESIKSKRPNGADEEPGNGKVALPYRNFYDVLAWCNAEDVQKNLR